MDGGYKRWNQTIVVENLAVKNMVKNPKLSQAISDVSWGEMALLVSVWKRGLY